LYLRLSATFNIANIVMLLLGFYYWIAHSSYRIIILYCVFNLVLFWITSSRRGKTLSSGINFGSVPAWLGISAVLLSGFLMLATSESLYKRPVEASVAIVAILVAFTVILLAETKDKTARFFQRPPVLLAMFAFLLLYAMFSVYLVQPNLMDGPAYAGVDPYRDYANAERILRLSRIVPEAMVSERYYRAFPVVPVQIAITSLVTGLPCNIAHIVLAVASTLLGVGCSVLLAWLIITRRRHTRIVVATMLPVSIVLLQPVLIDVQGSLTPLRLSVPLLLLVLYLGLSAANRDPKYLRPCYASIVPIIAVMVSMHAASSIMLVILFLAMAVFSVRVHFTRSFALSVAVLATVILGLYLTSLAGAPVTTLLGHLRLIYLSIKEITQTGPNFLNELGARGRGSIRVDEANSFLMSVPSAFVLAIASVMIVRSAEHKNRGAEPANRSGETLSAWRSLYLFYGLLFAVGLAVSYVLKAFGFGDPRYMVLPLTPLALIVTAQVVKLTLRNMSTAKGILLLGMLTLYAVSVGTSPVFLQETSPYGARLTPTQSERAAASFLSAKLQVDNTGAIQVYTDWPYIAHVHGVLNSDHFYGSNVNVPVLFYEPMVTGHRTIMLSREYFMESTFLRQLGPQLGHSYDQPLTDPEKWRAFNRIFDDSSTSIYYGTL